MSDLREKQPERQYLDMTHRTTGNSKWEVVVRAYTYSGVKNEDVYSLWTTFLIRSDTFWAAAGIAEMLAETIGRAHDVWKADAVKVVEQ